MIRIRNRNLAIIAGSIVSFILIVQLSSGWAKDAEKKESQQSVETSVDWEIEDGLSLLPEDLRNRWYSVTRDTSLAAYAEYIQEGEQIIRQLGRLVEALDGEIPTKDQPGFSVYSSMRNRLVEILDRITLRIISGLSDADIEALLSEYQGERQQLDSEIQSNRQRLLEDGIALLRQHQRDQFFLKYPHRRATIAGLYFRITELMYQETYERFLRETEEYINELTRLAETDPAAAGRLVPPKPDYSRVLAMYQRILDEFPTSDFADDALYNIGFLTSESDQPVQKANANRIFETLTTLYPQSNYKLNVLRKVADYYFNAPGDKLNDAVRVYNKIKDEFPDSRYYQEALYKLGWSYYKLSDLPTAAEYFALALDVGYTGKAAELEKSTVLDIAMESINYIGVCYAAPASEWSGGGVENLAAWLENHPERKKNYGRELIIQLGDIYRNQIGRFPQAVEAYSKYIELFPFEPDAYLMQVNVVEIYQQGQIVDATKAHFEKRRFFDTYNPDSEWWIATEDEEIRKDLIPRLEKYLDMIIDEILIIAADQGVTEAFVDFENYSRQYLRFWRNGHNAYKIHFNLATVLEGKLNQPASAMREYWQVVTAYKDTTNLEIACERIVAINTNLVKQEQAGEIFVTPDGIAQLPAAGVDSVLSPAATAQPGTGTGEAPAVEDSSGTEEKSEEVIPTRLLNSEGLLLAGFDLYFSHFPSSKLAPTLLYRAGDILYQHNLFVESRVYLGNLITAFPDNRLIEDAYRLIIEGHFQSKEFAAVEEVSRRIGESGVSSELKETANRRKAQSLFLNASDLKSGENHKAAADKFKRVALEAPDYEYADRSLFQAGLEYMQVKEWNEANDAFLLLSDRYPSSEYVDKALYNTGLTLQNEIKDIAGAAKIFERLVNSFPKSELARGALANASANYNEVEDHLAAIRVNEMYVSIFPEQEDANIYLFENAGHYLKLESIEKANEIYQRFAQKFPDDPRTVRAYFERGIYYLGQNDRSRAAREFTQTVDAHERLVSKGITGNPKAASQALAQLITWENEEYEKLKYKLPESALKAAVERKKQWRNALYQKYQNLLALGQKEGYHAFYQMGRLDEGLAVSTYDQETPEFRQAEQRREAVADIVNTSIILNEVTVQTYRQGLENLGAVYGEIIAQLDSRRKEYDAFSEVVTTMQKNNVTGLSDSLVKQSSLGRALVEIDSAVILAETWMTKVKEKIPEITSRNGFYLNRMWVENLSITVRERNEEIRLLTKEEILNSGVAPIAPEICGLHLQSLVVAAKYDQSAKYIDLLSEPYNATIDTLLSRYKTQCEIARNRADRFIQQYQAMLPEGEDAQSPDGFYPDEMGVIIQDQLDYLNAFSLDLLYAFSVVMDTVSRYTLPVGFGDEVHDSAMRFVLDQHQLFQAYKTLAQSLSAEYAALYEETDEIQYDDAAIAFEDLSAFIGDYDIALLEEGLRLKRDFNIPGEAGIQIMLALIKLNPEKYAAEFEIEGKKTAVLSSTDWKVWNMHAASYETADFMDFDWERASLADLPLGTNLGILDSLGAKAIWFWMPLPEPEYVETPGLEFENLQAEQADTSLAVSESPGEAGIDTTGGEEDLLDIIAEDAGLTGEEAAQAPPVKIDSTWQVWMAPDSLGARRYWFRKAFEIDSKPSGGHIWMTSDDDFSLFLNGYYIAEDRRDTIDWHEVKDFDVSQYLSMGPNLLAVEVADVDNSRNGLVFALVYESIPDLNQQLDLIVEKELERQNVSFNQRRSVWATTSEPVIPGDIKETEAPARSPEEIRRMRTIEKNKLR